MGLLVGTVCALLWNHFGMNTVWVIDPHSPNEIRLFDDRGGRNHGNSMASLERSDGRLVLLCDVGLRYQYPYCQLSIRLGDLPQGADLGGYDTLRVWLRSTGPEPQQQVRVALRNYNPAYSSPDDDETLKWQELIHVQRGDEQLLRARLAQFSVASWWMEEHNMPVEHAGLELDHVVSIDITTGSNLLPGPHRIEVSRIELEGKAIAPAPFRLGIIGIWMLAMMTYLVADALAARRQLAASRRSQEALSQTVESLRAQSDAQATRARLDPLTGLLNRHGLGEALHGLGEAQGGPLFPMALLFVDIDHFKRINDTHGHALGDEVIRGVGTAIRTHVQRGDLVTRWGGEEFLLLCPRTRLDEARQLAERLREQVAAATWPQGVRVSCSFGVAVAGDAPDLAPAIERADRAMYEAKRLGRNRVEVLCSAAADHS
jgi:diguanylate cyclase (GGDEF)-like protein